MNKKYAYFLAALIGTSITPAIAQTGSEVPLKLCGWFDNPTPANATLTDRSSIWVIGLQGGHQAEGDWPTFTSKQWIRTGSSYGYGCACVTALADVQNNTINKIVSSSSKPLSACRSDHRLPKRPT
jgi:hypothetical protein